MTSNRRFTFRVRLEDLVALTFFLLNFLVKVIFRGQGGAESESRRRV